MAQGIQAAGGVLWRPADSAAAVEIALVHRRRQRDWSLPKGKAHPGELPVETALREVLEETGHHSEVGPFLGAVRYHKHGAGKVVRYWSLEATGGSFIANRETDDLLWLPPKAALRLISARNTEVIGWFRLLLRTPAALGRVRQRGERRLRRTDRRGSDGWSGTPMSLEKRMREA